MFDLRQYADFIRDFVYTASKRMRHCRAHNNILHVMSAEQRSYAFSDLFSNMQCELGAASAKRNPVGVYVAAFITARRDFFSDVLFPHSQNVFVVCVKNAYAATGDGFGKLEFFIVNIFDTAESFEVLFANAAYYGVLRFRNRAKLGNVAGFSRPEFGNKNLFVPFHFLNRQRYAYRRIEIFFGRNRNKFVFNKKFQYFFTACFSVTSGYSHNYRIYCA
jgi:hypothetical protein